jgi:polysaccharide chain length determinant protein (PEP-CTERM system associated)
MISVFVAGLLITIVVAFTLPRAYRATGTIMVESQQVSDSMVSSTIIDKFDERISVLKQRVLTRENLLRLSDKYGLVKASQGSPPPMGLIDKIRDRIEVETISADSAKSASWQVRPTIAFTISFEDPRPEVAFQVTNDLISMFLDWNIKLRTEGAIETTNFLSQEAARLKAVVESIDGQINAYKKQNIDNLPEQLPLRTTIVSRSENDLYAVDRDIRSGNEELRSLETELAAAKHGMSDDPSQSLPALKAEYNKLSAIYTESHPDIKALKRKINMLEQASDTPDAADTSANVTSLAVYKIKAKIDGVKARLESLEKQRQMLKEKITHNEHAMELTPRVAQGLEVLIRDRDTAQKKYEELLGKKMSAKISENLESESKSERFTLLEPPLLPESPFKPNRLKVLAMGLFLSLACAVGVAAIFELIDKRIRGAEALTHVLGYRPLVVIPFLYTDEEEMSKKRISVRMIIDALWSWSQKYRWPWPQK